MSPLMEKLIEKYCALSGVAKNSIELQTIDSTAGMNGAISGTFDIGMASRDVKDSELSQGITAEVLAYDGIAFLWSRSVRSSPARCASGPPLHN